MRGRIVQLSCSRGGVPKTAVPRAFLTSSGLEGDQQAHPRIHGGPERALCLYSLERIQELQVEGHPIRPGSTGENVTTAGLEWGVLQVGTRLLLGPEVEIQISSYTAPCKNIAGSFVDGAFTRISQKVHPGYSRLYARVIREGWLSTGDEVQVR